MTDAGPVATAIREGISRRGWTAYRAAKEANVSPDPVYRFLRGERGLTLTLADALCRAMGLRVVDPHGGDES